MAYLSSGFKLNASSYLLHDGIFGISGACCGTRNIVTEVKGLGLERSPEIECKLILNEAKFPHSFRVDSSSVGWYKGKWNLMNRSVIRPSVRVESNGKQVTIWQEGRDAPLGESIKIPEPNYYSDLDYGNGGTDSSSGAGGNGKFPPNGGGDGGGGGDGDDDEENSKEEGEFGPLLKFEEVIKEAESRGASLPSDMLEAAKVNGIQKVLLDRYLDLQASAWPLGILMKSCALLRNRMLADPSFLFKVGTEIVIDSCCATFAEVKKRGKDFWAEFELYAADLLVGLVVSTVLVGLLAPYARIGQPSAAKGLLGRLAHVNGVLPSSVFEAERPGCKFSIQQRIGTYFYKGFLYGSVGFVCGLVGQGIANLIMTAKRSVKKSEEGVPVPPLVKSAALWGAFLAISSNTRYQIINGLERVVEASPVAKCVPPLAMAFTVGVRFANNIYGGMQFVDWARWSGVQ